MRRPAGGFRGAVLAALLLAPAAAAPPGPDELFPDANHLFRRLLADPRQAQTSLRYYRLAGRDAADVALGNTWGMRRWRLGRGGWEAQWDLEGMGYSRFLLSGAVNEFQTVDFFANVPVEVRRGDASARLTLFHESSHLGDDYIRRTGDKGARYSVEGLRAMASLDAGALLRLYGGGSELLHAIPPARRGTLQAGFELKTPDLRWLSHPCWLYLAADAQSKQAAGWNINSNAELGLRVAYPGVLRSLRVHADRFEGHSEYGQFRARRESTTGVGVSFDF